MPNCDEFHDRIVLFDDLSREEQEKVRAHTEDCPGCRRKLADVQAIMVGLAEGRASSHVEDELLTRYGLYLSDPEGPDFDGRRLTRAEIGEIEGHLRGCPPCHRKVDAVVQEYREMDAYLEKEGMPSLEVGVRTSPVSAVGGARGMLTTVTEILREFFASSRRGFYPAAGVALAAAVAVLWVSPLFRGDGYPYYRLAAIEEDMVRVTRGAGAPLLADGLFALDEGRDHDAIASLERFIGENPQDPSVGYAHVVTAVAYLSTARRDFLGRFQRVDTARIGSAIEHLQDATRDGNARVREDAYWFLGHAHLLQQRSEPANAAFRNVRELRGTRAKDAQEMLADLETISR